MTRDKILLTEFESELLSVFVKHKILRTEDVIETWDRLKKKILDYEKETK